MKHFKIAIFAALLINLCLASFAHAQTQPTFNLGVIYTRGSQQAAANFERELRATPAFNQLKNILRINSAMVSNDSIKCYNPAGSRLITCNNDQDFFDYARQNNFNGILAFTHLANGGRGTEKIAVVGGADYYRNAFHEFLHQLGFEDEYRYDGIDKHFGAEMCPRPKKSINVVYQDFSNLRFSSDAQARAYLADKIPWVRNIPSYVKIIDAKGNLGTPKGSYPPGTVGLFRGGACDHYSQGWVAQEHSVMNKNTDIPLAKLLTPYYTNLIRQALLNKTPLTSASEAWKANVNWARTQPQRDTRTFDQIKNGSRR